MNADRRLLEAALAPETRLDDLLALAGKRYTVAFENVALPGMDIELLQIADITAHLDRLVERARPGQSISLPFWAKLWPASLPLALLVSRLKPAPGARLLELGAGLGLCGLAAARQGVPSLITDVEPESLLFIRASILKNGLEATARAAFLDMAAPSCDESFEIIVASEALYLPALHEPMAQFLAGNLAPGPDSQVLLSCDQVREAAPFFARVSRDFDIQRTQSACRADSGETKTCMLYRMRSRAHA